MDSELMSIRLEFEGLEVSALPPAGLRMVCSFCPGLFLLWRWGRWFLRCSVTIWRCSWALALSPTMRKSVPSSDPPGLSARPGAALFCAPLLFDKWVRAPSSGPSVNSWLLMQAERQFCFPF